jgi:myo-inositol-1(or 4)-monophosphatase
LERRLALVRPLQFWRRVTEPLLSLRNAAVDIAREAGALLMEGFRSAPAFRAKRSESDLVTEYDERSEHLLRERLGAAFPGVAVVGEETGGERGGGAVWYVDPIDGTSNFGHGHPYFCISLGLWEGESPVCGVVHAPAMGLTYAAARGQGVERIGERVRVSAVRELPRALLSSGFPSDRATRRPDPYNAFVAVDRASHGLRRCGAAALEQSLVADGACDGFWEVGLAAWDLAAGALFVKEAGGEVTDLEGRPLALDAGEVLASNGLLHEPLLVALAHARALPPIGGMP